VSTSLEEVKALLDREAAEGNRRHDDNVKWRGHVESSLRGLTDSVTHQGVALADHDRRLRDGEMDRGRLESDVGKDLKAITGRLDKQDIVLAETRDFVVGTTATLRFVKIALTLGPIIIGALVALAHYAALAEHVAHP
jgi:hypothetical protein